MSNQFMKLLRWNTSTKGAKTWSELPALAVKYVRRLEELISSRVVILKLAQNEKIQY